MINTFISFKYYDLRRLLKKPVINYYYSYSYLVFVKVANNNFLVVYYFFYAYMFGFSHGNIQLKRLTLNCDLELRTAAPTCTF